MIRHLNKIRAVNKDVPIGKKIVHSIGVLIVGLILGVSIKFFDVTFGNNKKIA